MIKSLTHLLGWNHASCHSVFWIWPPLAKILLKVRVVRKGNYPYWHCLEKFKTFSASGSDYYLGNLFTHQLFFFSTGMYFPILYILVIFLSSCISSIFLLVLAFVHGFSVADISLAYILRRGYSVSNKNYAGGFCHVKETEVLCQKGSNYHFIFVKWTVSSTACFLWEVCNAQRSFVLVVCCSSPKHHGRGTKCLCAHQPSSGAALPEQCRSPTRADVAQGWTTLAEEAGSSRLWGWKCAEGKKGGQAPVVIAFWGVWRHVIPVGDAIAIESSGWRVREVRDI